MKALLLLLCVAIPQDGWRSGGWNAVEDERPAVRQIQERAASPSLQDATRNAVKVTFPSGNGANVGSGVYLGDRFVATAYHVPRGTSGRGTVSFRDGVRIACEVVMKDPIYDQCVLQLSKEHPTLPGVEVAEKNPQRGQMVYSAGFGNGFRVFGGPVGEWGTPVGGGKSDWFDHQNPAVSGDSGGPVFTQTGRLIGCLWGSDGRNTTASGTGRFHLFIRPLFPRLAQWRANRIARQIQGIGYSQGSQCTPYGCPPVSGSGGVNVQYPSNPRITPPSLTPTLPPPNSSLALTPSHPGGGCNCNCGSPAKPDSGLDADKIYADLRDDLLARMKKDPAFRGPAGQDGKNGKDGRNGIDGKDGSGEIRPEQLAAITQSILSVMQSDPSFRGPAGPRGPAGSPASLDVDAIKREILAAIEHPDRDVLLVDGSTNTVLDKETYAPGEPIVLDFQNIIRSAQQSAR